MTLFLIDGGQGSETSVGFTLPSVRQPPVVNLPLHLEHWPLPEWWAGTLKVLGGKLFLPPSASQCLLLASPSVPALPPAPITDLVHHQEVLYGFPIGKDYVSCVLHSLRQDLLHFLCDDTWGQAKGVWLGVPPVAAYSFLEKYLRLSFEEP